MMYDTDYAIYQYINAQVEQYVEFDDLLKQNHCTMEEAQQEIKAFREKYHSLLAGYAFSDCDLAAACEELMAQMEQHPGSLDLQYLYLCIVTDFGLLWNAGGAGALRRAGSQKLFPSAGTDAGTDRIFAGAG